MKRNGNLKRKNTSLTSCNLKGVQWKVIVRFAPEKCVRDKETRTPVLRSAEALSSQAKSIGDKKKENSLGLMKTQAGIWANLRKGGKKINFPNGESM